ncbi:MAG TPA: FmdB family zinc ribbon protein [Chthoniobacter sp.]|jgi:putative FmdB family regulatory protein
MPVYEYECEDCGEFSESRVIAERNHPALCPTCGGPAPRNISAPFLAVMSPVQRMAATRNERSQHEPRMTSGRPCCASGGCSHTRKKKAKAADGEKPALQASKKKYRRPWMLGH